MITNERLKDYLSFKMIVTLSALYCFLFFGLAVQTDSNILNSLKIIQIMTHVNIKSIDKLIQQGYIVSRPHYKHSLITFIFDLTQTQMLLVLSKIYQLLIQV